MLDHVFDHSGSVVGRQVRLINSGAAADAAAAHPSIQPLLTFSLSGSEGSFIPAATGPVSELQDKHTHTHTREVFGGRSLEKSHTGPSSQAKSRVGLQPSCHRLTPAPPGTLERALEPSLLLSNPTGSRRNDALLMAPCIRSYTLTS